MRNRWFLWIGSGLTIVGAAGYLGEHLLPMVYLLLMGLILLAAGFLVGPRYGRELPEPPEGYISTGERFVDPTTKRTVEVFQHPSTGHRVYVTPRDPQ